jgi:hypothetical protein
MTLPSSGPLTLADIQTEFGGSNPISLSEYYAGGAYVPAGTSGTYGAVPSSGAISIQNFYGTSSVIVDFNDHSVNASAGGYSEAGYAIFGAGSAIGKVYEEYNGGGYSTLVQQWCTPTSQGGNYEVYAGDTSGVVVGTVNSWVATSGNPYWYVDISGSGNSVYAQLAFQVRRTGTGTVIDTWTVDLSADAL